MKQKLIKDLSGKRFGSLTAIERQDCNESVSNHRGVMWLCLCDCGNYKYISSCDLLSGNTTSCGCKWKSKPKDLTNRTFGSLTVIEKIGSNRRGILWRCKCKCGNVVEVCSNSLVFGSTSSCGCVKSKLETETRNALNKRYIKTDSQITYKDLVSPKLYRLMFDIGIIDKAGDIVCLIECQGIQHYYDFGEFGKTQREVTDQMKREYCAAHDIPLYEIAYNENIEQRLDEILEDLKQTHSIDLATIYDNTVPSLDEAS